VYWFCDSDRSVLCVGIAGTMTLYFPLMNLTKILFYQ
jgi:hypothetical protein